MTKPSQRVKVDEWLNLDVIQHVQDVFAEMTGTSVVLCRRDGHVLTHPSFGGVDVRGSADIDERFGRKAVGAARRTARGGERVLGRVRGGGYRCLSPIFVNGSRLATLVVVTDVRGWLGEDADDVAARRTVDSGDLAAWVAGLSSVVTSLAEWSRRERQLRLRVREFGLLHSVSSLFAGRANLDEILRITAEQVVSATQAKACTIRLFDRDKGELRIQAVANLSNAYLRKGPVKLSRSKIDQAALRGDPVPIGNMTKDPRVIYKAEARREGLVSGLAVGMIYRGQPVGVVHVYTGRPYQFHRYEIEAIKAIASQGASAVINARLYEEARRAEQMDRQLKLAGQVQRRMLPRSFPRAPKLRIGGVYEPSYVIGGDFYDFLALGGGRIALTIADVAGKGVPASLQMASLRSALRAYAMDGHGIEQILERTNRAFRRDTLTDEFASLFFGIIDSESGELAYLGAGHNPPILVRGGRLRELSSTGPVLGVFAKPKYRARQLRLREGDALVLFTDGAFEAMNFDQNVFGMKRLRASIRKYSDLAAQAMAENILWDVRRFVGLATQSDDISLVVAKYGEYDE